jgi:hypothetical protein
MWIACQEIDATEAASKTILRLQAEIDKGNKLVEYRMRFSLSWQKK